jgi:aconitate hydratase
MLPFVIEEDLENNDYVFIPGIAGAIGSAAPSLEGWLIRGGKPRLLPLKTPELNPIEREIVLAGCLINYNRKQLEKRRL